MRKSNLKKSIAIALALTFAIGNLPISTVKAFAEELSTKTIQILATTDLHGRYMNYEYARDINSDGGLTQIATIVKQERAKDPNLMVVDNGDAIQGNYNHLFLKAGQVNPMMLAMNEIGYDVFNLGNHEFNFGMNLINEIAGQANANLNVLCANLYRNSDKTRAFKPYMIKNVDGVKVAVIGVVSPWISKWDGPNLKDYTPTNPAEEVGKVINEIKAAGGADVYVVSAHAGLEGEYGDDSARGIAEKNLDVSAIIMGHSHEQKPEIKAGNAILVQPTNNGGDVSKIAISVQKTATGYQVIDKKGTILSTKGIAPDADLTAKLDTYHQAALKDARSVIGTLDKDLAVKDEVTGIPESLVSDQGITEFVNEVQLYNSKKHLINKGIDPNSGYQVSAAALFDAKSNMLAGNITKAGVSNIYKYDNKLYTIKTNGKQLKKFMEWTASIYNTVNIGDLTVSLNEKIRLYQYDMLDGISYDINVAKSAGQRIENVKFKKDGKVVEDNDVVYLSVNNYRYDSVLNAALGPVFEPGTHEKVYDTNSDTISDMRDLISDYIVNVKGGKITRTVDNNWKLTGVNYDAPLRAEAVKLINDGTIKLPTSADGRTPNVKSIVWNDVLKAQGNKRVDIMSFNDFHGNIEESGKNIGAAKLASLIKSKKSLKDSNYEAFVMSSGDLYQGTAISNLTYGKPVSDFLKEIGLTASAIGNHEFDWGISKIENWEKDGSFPFLAANIVDKATEKPVTWADPYTIIESNGIKIGVIGITTEETAYKTKPENVKDVKFLAPAGVVNKYTKQLKEVDKVNAVVVLSHLGAVLNKTTNTIVGEAADLAKATTGVDAIIAAHDHQFTAGKVNNVAIVQAGYSGRGLANLSLDFNADGKLLSVIPTTDEVYKRVTQIKADKVVADMVAKYRAELAPILDEKVTDLDKSLTYDAKTGLAPLGIVVSETMRKITNSDIAITNGGGIRTPLEKGPITVGHMYTILPFDNTLVTMDLKGSDIKANIELGIMPTNMSWGQFSGIKVWYDENKAAGERVTSIRLANGEKLDMDKYYKVVVNDFMATGGDGYKFANAKNIVDTNIVMRDSIMADWKANGIKSDVEKLLFIGADDTVITPEVPEVKPEVPEVKPEVPEVKPEVPEVKPEVSGTNDLPKTGGINPVSILILGSLIAGSGYFIYRKREEKEEDIA